MTSIGEYLNVECLPRPQNRKTDIWVVTATRGGDKLGEVSWFGRWRQYVFSPVASTHFNHVCLVDLAGFLDQVNKARRKPKPVCTCPSHPCQVHGNETLRERYTPDKDHG